MIGYLLCSPIGSGQGFTTILNGFSKYVFMTCRGVCFHKMRKHHTLTTSQVSSNTDMFGNRCAFSKQIKQTSAGGKSVQPQVGLGGTNTYEK